MRDPVATLAFLEKEAYRMHFFQILRLIENAYPDKPRIGESLRPRDDVLRFGQLPELKFHSTMIEGMEPANAYHPPRLIVNFFGMMGPQGPMPTHFTEYVRDRLRSPVPDPTWVRFLDIFHHRFLSLFYRVHAMGDPVISLDRQDNDRFSTYVGSMFGLGTPALQHRDEVSDFAKLHFAGLLSNRIRPASGLVSILREYFKLPIKLEQFVGHWMTLDPEIRSRLGTNDSSCQLGMGTVLGSRVWDCQNKFRLIIGPLDYDDYCRMLPNGDSMKRLRAWVRNYVDNSLEWDVRLILKKEQTPPLKLGGSSATGVRLGWTTWLKSAALPRDPDQLLVNPTARMGSTTRED